MDTRLVDARRADGATLSLGASPKSMDEGPAECAMASSMPTRTVPVRLSLGSEPATQANATIADWTMLERLRRAAVGLAISWSLAGVSIIIPGLHFILPPILLLAGPIVFVWRFVVRSSFTEVNGVCPRCKVERQMPMGGGVKDETNVLCDGCGNQLTLRLIAATPPGA